MYFVNIIQFFLLLTASDIKLWLSKMLYKEHVKCLMLPEIRFPSWQESMQMLYVGNTEVVPRLL